MQEGGWIKLYRSIRKHWLWEDAEKLKWWIDILLQANHQERKILIGNELVTIERGSFHTSIMKLSDRWHVDRKTVKKFLELLEKDKMITLKTSKKGTTLKVSNYEGYQAISDMQSPNKMDNTMDNGVDKGMDISMDNGVPIKSQQSGHKQELKNYKNYKNDEKGEEREEGKEESVPVLQPLSFPTDTHKKIYDNTSEVSYRTWFIDTEITETDNKITIQANSDFIKGVIINKFKDKLYNIFLKEIEVV
ncbi:MULTISPECIES: hypothetical protein [unclassified Clostridium]|uniref:hypothetical protein n=1 Tax=unclassified Clostridium TaxID=2614128 RepID=UPI00290DEE03|nr:hypothetical protein [Clostridium sp.]MDU5107153.1 hypothetical protein [Clostridium sp.]